MSQLENRLIRMQKDLWRALEKPVEKRSWIMGIDVDKCIGCYSCVVACKAENVSPPGVSYRSVPEAEFGEYPKVERVFMPTNCQQCDNPPCIKGVPEDAYTKRPDGILVFHYGKLKGNDLYKKTQNQCPYTALYQDTGEFYTKGTQELQPYETRESFEYGETLVRKDKKGILVGAVRKCHFCLHRLESEMLPACVTTCVGGAMYFGDKNDSKSLISELLGKRQSTRIEKGTKPRVIYLTGTVFDVETCLKCHG